MNDLTTYKDPQFGAVRARSNNGFPLLCAMDVCKALGYKNGRDAVARHVDKEDVVKCDTPTMGGNQVLSFINESGFYSLILASKMPQAKSFKRWVTTEVLPSIRKTGGYIVVSEKETPEEIMARALVVAQDTLARQKRKLEALANENLMLQAENEELRVKSDYVERILASNELMAITQIAADYGMGGKAMNMLLYQLRVQYKVNGQWVLYDKYKNKGYTQSKTFDINGGAGSATHTYWRQKGRLFLYELLKKNGILPMIERA